MSKPFFSPTSRRDLLEILDYISKDKPGAAVRHLERLENECWRLAGEPSLGTIRDDLVPGLRCWAVGKYIIFYRPVEEGIEVVRVIHGARDIGQLFE